MSTSSRSILTPLGFPELVLSTWEADGITTLLPIQMKGIASGNLFTKSTLVIGPTSCGKTFVGELVCVHHALAGRKCVYLVPFKALAEEKYQDFRRKYGKEAVGAQVIISTADRRESDRALVDGDFHIAVLTYEKLAAMIVTHPSMLSTVGAVVIDEVQMLRDESRGAELELMLTRARQIAPNLQIIGLSAVVSDLNGFDEWLGAHVIADDHRPVPLREGTISPNGSFSYVEWDGKTRRKGDETITKLQGITEDEYAASLAAHLLTDPKEQIIVFAHTVAGTQSLAKSIAAQAKALPPATELLQRLAGLEATDAVSTLNETLGHAVAFHNADLTLDERLAVEDAFRKRIVRCIVSTSTLSMGVNLPASSVIIVKATKWTKPAGGWAEVPLTVAEYRNMSGRAGRYGLSSDSFGRSFLICKSPFDAASKITGYVDAKPEPLASVLLNKAMEDVLLKTLASRLCDTADGCCRFLLRTYAAKIHLATTEQHEALKNDVDVAIKSLIKSDFLAPDKKGKLIATPLGTACASSGFSVGSFARIVEAVTKSAPSPTDVAYLASVLPEAGPNASGIRLATAEHQGRGPHFIELVRQAEQQMPGTLTRARLDALPTAFLPDFDTVHSIKIQAVAIAYVSGIASKEIEDKFGASAGKARNLGGLCSWISDTAARISWILKPAVAKEYERLSDRFLHGCTEKALLIAAIPHSLHRAEREALVTAGFDSLQKILDTSAIDIAKSAKVNRHRVEHLQKKIVETLGESLTLERQQLARLHSLGEPTTILESLYALKSTALEQAIEELLVAPFCPLTVNRIASQREGEADLRIILSDGHNGVAQVTAKDAPTDKVGIVKATAILAQSPELSPKVFICIGRPDFLPDTIKKASAHVSAGKNYKLIPVFVLAEMFVRFKEGKITSARVSEILEKETGYIDVKRL